MEEVLAIAMAVNAFKIRALFNSKNQGLKKEPPLNNDSPEPPPGQS